MSTQETKPDAPPAVAAAAKPKTTRIRTLRAVSGRVWDAATKGFVDQIVEPGNVVDVHPDDAKILVETKYKGHFGFSGERWGDDAKKMHSYQRAEYVTP
jgi:hypothetical protein